MNTPHLNFIEVQYPKKSRPRKTKSWNVQNVHNDAMLGEIKWYGPWRNFVFYPCPDTLYDERCLTIIKDFMVMKKADWKANKKV